MCEVVMGTAESRPEIAAEQRADLPALSDALVLNRGTTLIRQPMLKFHSVHGDNLQLVRAGRRAKRKESFCKSLAFSNRPILIDEIVCIKLTEVSSSWSGVLRFGLTSVDPASFRDIELPKYACPDLTSKNGFWAKALPERYCVQDCVIHFMVDAEGQIHYGVNGLSKGVFLAGINVHTNLWAIFDIYGNSKSIEFLDMTTDPDIFSRPPPEVSIGADLLESSRSAISSRSSDSALRFSPFYGPTVELDPTRQFASRRPSEFSQAYVFTHRPIRVGEHFAVIIMKHIAEFVGSLAFGLTACDPAAIGDMTTLPVDSDHLLERPEYWVSIKNIAVAPKPGDVLTFWVEENGAVMFSKNERQPAAIMYVDTSVPLWAFFDLYGSTSKIRIADPTDMDHLREIRENHRGPRTASAAPTSRDVSRLANIRVQLPPPEDRRSSSSDSSDHSPVGRRRPLSTDLARIIGERVAIPATTTSAITPSSLTTTRAAYSASPLRTRADSRLDTSAATHSSSTSGRLNAPTFSLSSSSNQLDLSPSSTSTNSNSSASSTTNNDDMTFGGLIPPLSGFDSGRRLPPLYTPSLSRPSPPSPSAMDVDTPTTAAQSAAADAFAHRLVADRIQSLQSMLSSISTTLNETHSSPAIPITSTTSSTTTPAPATPPRFISATAAVAAARTTTTAPSAGGSSALSRQRSAPSTSSDPTAAAGGLDSECVVCMSERVDSVLYRCGHMCMCFACAKRTMDSTSICPLCRQPVQDVIRCYPS